MFCHMRWSVTFDLIPYLRKMSVKLQSSGHLIDSGSHPEKLQS